MKKGIIAIALVTVFGLVDILQAGPIGRIKPEGKRLTVSGLIDISNRDLEFDVAGNANKDEWEGDRNLFLVEAKYHFNDWVSAFLRLGAASVDADDKADAVSATPAPSLDLGSEFAWGLGLQGTFWKYNEWSIMGDVQFNSHTGHSTTVPGSNPVETVDADVDEWQVSLLVGYQYLQALIYGGIKFSDLNIDFTETTAGASQTSDGEGQDNFGVLFGVDFDFYDDWNFYLEGRFIDETAFAAGLGYTFF